MDALQSDPARFASEFDSWKAQGSAGEFESFLFGKDGAYVRPEVAGEKYRLRHVHLVPLKNPEQLTAWQRLWRFRGRKTSDRVLVYASNTRGDHLLIFILEEPLAHQIALMKTPEDEALMGKFAAIADAFLHDGSVIA